MLTYVLQHGNIVYVTSTIIPPLNLEDLFQLFYKEFAMELAEQGLYFINHNNTFKLKCLEVKRLVRKMTPGEIFWIDNKGGSVLVLCLLVIPCDLFSII